MDKKRRKRLEEFIAPFRVKPGSKVALARDFDPAFKAGIKKKKEGTELLAEGVRLLTEYQARLAAQDTWGVLVVIQGLDSAGKDGTIRHVMSGVNPQGVAVRSFKVPSAEELDHDFLWRYTRGLPRRGEIGIFNRSHYEEVLVVRVHSENLERQKLPEAAKKGDVWKRRYRSINDWERHLTENGFRVVKLCLNLSKEEQRRRLLRRIDLPDHNWKFSEADIRERQLWDRYQEAFSEMLTHTSTEWAPWHVIPADHKWFARTAAAAVLVNALVEIDPRYPSVTKKQRRGAPRGQAGPRGGGAEGRRARSLREARSDHGDGGPICGRGVANRPLVRRLRRGGHDPNRRRSGGGPVGSAGGGPARAGWAERSACGEDRPRVEALALGHAASPMSSARARFSHSSFVTQRSSSVSTR